MCDIEMFLKSSYVVLRHGGVSALGLAFVLVIISDKRNLEPEFRAEEGTA